jgi:hypothetical protein
VLAAGDHMYRLPAGGSAWQDMGPMPGSTSSSPTPPLPTAHYYPTLSGGVLWLSVGSGWDVASYPAT